MLVDTPLADTDVSGEHKANKQLTSYFHVESCCKFGIAV